LYTIKNSSVRYLILRRIAISKGYEGLRRSSRNPWTINFDGAWRRRRRLRAPGRHRYEN